jgi:hypothetical protein
MFKKKYGLLLFSLGILIICTLIILQNYLILFGLISLFILCFLSLNFPLLFLLIIILVFEQGAQIFDFGIKTWIYPDIAIVLLAIGLLSQLIKRKFNISKIVSNQYAKYILLLYIIILSTTVFGSFMMLKQPLSSLFFTARPFFLYLVFPYLLLSDFNSEHIIKFFLFTIYSALFISILVIIDANLLGGGIIFQLAMSNGVSGIRGDKVRIFTYPYITLWGYFSLLSIIKLSKRLITKIFFTICLLIIAYQLIFCNMTRQLIVIIVLTTSLYFIKNKLFSNILASILIGIILCCAIFIFSYNTDLFNNSILSEIVKNTQIEASQPTKGNIAVRLNAIRYYFPYYAKTGFLGMGMMSYTYEDSPVREGMRKAYSFWDLGLISILFRFGIFSIIFIFFVLKRIFSDLKYIKKKTNKFKTILISDSLNYLFISQIILLPSSYIFFSEGTCLYYGILFYFIFKLKKETRNFPDLPALKPIQV